MRITVTSGDRQVEVKVKGKSAKKLRAAEEIAGRLLTSTPEPEPKPPVGFTAVADTERADDPDE